MATRNALRVLYRACRLLSGRRYQTLSMGYIVSFGLYNLLLRPSSTPQAPIENVIKKFLLDAYTEHFDTKLSTDQEHAMIVSVHISLHIFLLLSNSDMGHLLVSDFGNYWQSLFNEESHTKTVLEK